MATEYPALNRIHVVGYSANDTDYPILGLIADPRVAGYKVPEDFSVCPDKRYPNHIFTGAQPISGDQRVRHTWEILPSPWVPFTRYDDDLGPIQGRRRSVKNEGQKASLTSSTKISYEGREGSAIVSNEIEETWQIKVDDDGNSLFPVKVRDFYDASRGAVEERRQLFVPTGEEVATLENVNGIITQTSYEPYNEYLSYKVVQTYAVDGPQLVGNSTNNDGQLVTVTTQRKAADNYTPPQPTATRTVEVSREDIESLVERVVDTPEVFAGKTFQVSKVDLTPQKFRAAQQDVTFEQTIEGEASQPTLASGEFAKSEQQVNKFLKRVSTNSRAINQVVVLVERILTPERQIATRTLRLASGDQTFTPSATLIDANVEALGDGRTVKTEITVPNVFDGTLRSASKPEVIPEQFRANIPTRTTQQTVAGSLSFPSLGINDLEKSEQKTSEFTVRRTTVSRDFGVFPTLSGQDYEPTLNIVIPYTESVTHSGASRGSNATIIDPLSSDYDLVKKFDLNAIEEALEELLLEFPTRTSLTLPPILKGVELIWSHSQEDGNYFSSGFTSQVIGNGRSISESGSASASSSVRPDFKIDIEQVFASNVPTTSYIFFLKYPITIGDILSKVGAAQWPVFKPQSHTLVAKGESKVATTSASGTSSITKADSRGGATFLLFSKSAGSGDSAKADNIVSTATIPPCLHGQINITESGIKEATGTASVSFNWPDVQIPNKARVVTSNGTPPSNLPATNPEDIPRQGKYLIDSRVELYQYGYARVYAEVLDASIFA